MWKRWGVCLLCFPLIAFLLGLSKGRVGFNTTRGFISPFWCRMREYKIGSTVPRKYCTYLEEKGWFLSHVFKSGTVPIIYILNEHKLIFFFNLYIFLKLKLKCQSELISGFKVFHHVAVQISCRRAAVWLLLLLLCLAHVLPCFCAVMAVRCDGVYHKPKIFTCCLIICKLSKAAIFSAWMWVDE